MSRTAANADVFCAIADPTRRQILDALAKGEAPVKMLLPMFDMSQPAISQHLKVLRDVGLVAERREGRERIYCVVAAQLELVADWAMQYERFWKRQLGQLGNYLDEHHGAARVGSRQRHSRKGQ